jgi:hypothetical protein
MESAHGCRIQVVCLAAFGPRIERGSKDRGERHRPDEILLSFCRLDVLMVCYPLKNKYSGYGTRTPPPPIWHDSIESGPTISFESGPSGRPCVPAEYRHANASPHLYTESISCGAVGPVDSPILGATMKSLQRVGTVFLSSALSIGRQHATGNAISTSVWVLGRRTYRASRIH